MQTSIFQSDFLPQATISGFAGLLLSLLLLRPQAQ